MKCDLCGLDPGLCQCKMCPVCGVHGDPKCYSEHGLQGDFGVREKQRCAALELVLLYHDTSSGWGVKQIGEWVELQRKAGIENPADMATTKTLCDIIRKVLEKTS